MRMIDRCARLSKLNSVNPFLKCGISLAAMLICLASNGPVASVFAMVSVFTILTLAGKTPAKSIGKAMAVPAVFLLVSCLSVAVLVLEEPYGILNLPLLGRYLGITAESAFSAGKWFLTAYGAVSCMYFLSFTTTVPELIFVLKRIHVPDVVVELMYLIYRYLFLLMERWDQMNTAAGSRQGYQSVHSSWYTFTRLAGNLLADSFRRSRVCFDAMESRCYQGVIDFYVEVPPMKVRHTVPAVVYLVLLAGLACFGTWKGTW